MKPSRFTEEQIIGILREHEAGAKTADVVFMPTSLQHKVIREIANSAAAAISFRDEGVFFCRCRISKYMYRLSRHGSVGLSPNPIGHSLSSRWLSSSRSGCR
jgi:hypothetical protein